MTTEAIRVLIADDQRVVRDGLSMLVALIDDVEVVGTACDGAEAVRLAAARRPDVIMMDLRMPGTDGITATADLRERQPAARVGGTARAGPTAAGWLVELEVPT